MALLSALSLISATAETHAAPQWNLGAVLSGCVLGDSGDGLQRAAFCGELRSDVLFGRGSSRDYGVGPYLSLGTAAFEDLRGTLGISALLPIIEDFPLVLSVGGLATDTGELGLDSSAFFGIRSYDHYGAYNFGAGLVLGTERSLLEGSETVWSLGVQIDGLIVATPFLLAWGALQ